MILWGSFPPKALRPNLVRIHGIVNSMKYQEKISLPLPGICSWVMGHGKIIVQVHIKWFIDNRIKLLTCPSLSPDLNHKRESPQDRT